MVSLRKKLGTGVRVLREGGLRSFASHVRLKAGMWWRLDDRFGLSRLTGTPNRLVRLDGYKFDAGHYEDLRELMLTGAYERQERKAIAQFVDGRLPVAELGGCIGVVSCLTNIRLSDAERHVVIEANPDLVPLIEANRERNRCRFKVLHRALAYGGGEAIFHIAEDVLCSSVQFPTSKTVRVPAVTLRSLLDEYNFEPCTLICDVEGGEVELVENEADVLSERVAVFIVEVHEHLFGAEVTGRMLDTLDRFGFTKVFQDDETYVFQNRRAGSFGG